MNIYIASSWKNQANVIKLANTLEYSGGFNVDAFCRPSSPSHKRYAFHWTEFVREEMELLNYDAIDFLADHRTQRAFKEDKKWLDWADTVIMYMPCGRSSHLEAGYAKGKGKRLYIYGDFLKGEFEVMYGFADGLFRTEEQTLLMTELRKVRVGQ